MRDRSILLNFCRTLVKARLRACASTFAGGCFRVAILLCHRYLLLAAQTSKFFDSSELRGLFDANTSPLDAVGNAETILNDQAIPCSRAKLGLQLLYSVKSRV